MGYFHLNTGGSKPQMSSFSASRNSCRGRKRQQRPQMLKKTDEKINSSLRYFSPRVFLLMCKEVGKRERVVRRGRLGGRNCPGRALGDGHGQPRGTSHVLGSFGASMSNQLLKSTTRVRRAPVHPQIHHTPPTDPPQTPHTHPQTHQTHTDPSHTAPNPLRTHPDPIAPPRFHAAPLPIPPKAGAAPKIFTRPKSNPRQKDQ